MQIFPNLKINLMRFARLAFGFLHLNVLKTIFPCNKKISSDLEEIVFSCARSWYLTAELW